MPSLSFHVLSSTTYDTLYPVELGSTELNKFKKETPWSQRAEAQEAGKTNLNNTSAN